MSKVKDGNYIVIQSFMVTDLKLKGNELMIYAIIYGFCQNEQRFSGSLQYLADWTNSTRQSVFSNLKKLCDKGMIAKSEEYINGVKFCSYTVQKTLTGCTKNFNGGVQKTLTNNIEDNLSINYIESGAKAPSPSGSIEQCVNYQEWRAIYNEVCTRLPQCRSLTDKRKTSIRSAMKQGITIDDFKTACEKANTSSFMTGNNDRGWKAMPDFLFNANNITKILEGNYDDKKDQQQEQRADYSDVTDSLKEWGLLC